jgi:mycothiol synthase
MKMNIKLSTDKTLLDSTLRLRPPQWSDAEGVAQLIYDACVADGDAILAISTDELRHGWQDPQFDLEKDAFVVITPEERIVGYDEVTNEYGHAIFRMDGNVHPDFKGRGIGTTLLRAVAQRARELIERAEPEARVLIRTTIYKNDVEGNALHLNEGYQPYRYHWRMEINLKSPPDQPHLPDGLEFRPFMKDEHDVAVWQAENEAFRDHPGSHESTLEDWRRERFDDPEFDPSLWAVAWDGDEIAGFAINRYRIGIGWIRTLGVRRPWRGRGVGEALLLHSFDEYYRRGMHTIGLGVDANNPTGATRLYQRVGMHAASEHVSYERELRPGRRTDEE